MKLYTEFEVTKSIAITLNYDITCTNDVLERLTPIELPSDEEIEEAANTQSHYEGAMWLKYKILNQNK